MSGREKIRVDLVTGFLGAGKTTFIKKYGRYLKERNITFAVIENEYGGAGIDSSILANTDIETRELAGGCMCCTLKVGFYDMLLELADKGFDRIIVEPSGIYEVGQFFNIMSAAKIRESYEIGTVISIVDPSQMSVYNSEDTEFLKHQLQCVDGIILSKTQNISGSELAAGINRIAAIAPETPVIYDEPWESISESFFDRLSGLERAGAVFEADSRHSDFFHNFTVFPEAVYDEDSLMTVIEQITSGQCGNVMRVKGFVYSADGGYMVDVANNTADIRITGHIKEAQINIIGAHINENKLAEIFE